MAVRRETCFNKLFIVASSVRSFLVTLETIGHKWISWKKLALIICPPLYILYVIMLCDLASPMAPPQHCQGVLPWPFAMIMPLKCNVNAMGRHAAPWYMAWSWHANNNVDGLLENEHSWQCHGLVRTEPPSNFVEDNNDLKATVTAYVTMACVRRGRRRVVHGGPRVFEAAKVYASLHVRMPVPCNTQAFVGMVIKATALSHCHSFCSRQRPRNDISAVTAAHERELLWPSLPVPWCVPWHAIALPPIIVSLPIPFDENDPGYTLQFSLCPLSTQ